MRVRALTLALALALATAFFILRRRKRANVGGHVALVHARCTLLLLLLLWLLLLLLLLPLALLQTHDFVARALRIKLHRVIVNDARVLLVQRLWLWLRRAWRLHCVFIIMCANNYSAKHEGS